MMKYFLRLLVAIPMVFCFQNYALCAHTCKIGVVDMQKFQEESKSFQKIREELKRQFEFLKDKLDKEKQELLKIEEDLKKQSMMLSLDAKAGKQKELDKKARYIKFLQSEYTREMKNAELEAKMRVQRVLKQAVKEIGQKKGYTLIIEKQALGLFFSDDALDITEEVIKAYDRSKQ